MQRLETAANVAALALCLGAGGVLCHRLGHEEPSREPARAVRQGDRLDLPAEALPDDGRTHILLVALQPGCPSCTRSLPFYRTLLERRDSATTRVVAMVPREEQLPAARRALDGARIVPDVLIAADFRRLGIRATPTLLWTDPRGEVRKVWFGLLEKAQEQDVFRALGETPGQASSAVPARKQSRGGSPDAARALGVAAGGLWRS